MSCDGILTARVLESSNTYWKTDLSWLKLVTKDNYEDTRQTMGIAVPEYFSGDYNFFANKREQLMHREEFKRSEALIRDTIKSYLPDSAIDKWLLCELGASGNGAVLLAWARDVGVDTATLKISWKPMDGTGIGPLKNTKITMIGGTIDKEQQDIFTKNEFVGEASLLLKRNSSNSTIHIIINGSVSSGAIFSTSVLIDPYKKETVHELKTYPSVNVGQLMKAVMNIPPNPTLERDVEVYVRNECTYDISGDPWHQMEVKVDGAQAWFQRKVTNPAGWGGPVNVMDYRFIRHLKPGQAMLVEAKLDNFRTANKLLTIEAKEVKYY